MHHLEHFIGWYQMKSSKIIVSAKKEKYKNLIAYSAINKFLIRNKILAPNLYAHNFSKGIIVIEDFGDLSYYKILLKKKNKLINLQKTYRFTIKNSKNKTKIKNKKYLIKGYIKLKNIPINIYLKNPIYFLIGIYLYF